VVFAPLPRLAADGCPMKIQQPPKQPIMKINFTVPTFSVIRVDEIEFLSQFDENKLRKWERE
jgi:hypothetical protein